MYLDIFDEITGILLPYIFEIFNSAFRSTWQKKRGGVVASHVQYVYVYVWKSYVDSRPWLDTIRVGGLVDGPIWLKTIVLFL